MKAPVARVRRPLCPLAVRLMMAGVCTAAITLTGAASVEAQSPQSADSSELALLRASMLVRDHIDTYLELNRTVLQPAIRLSSPTHRRDAERALQSLDMVEAARADALAGLPLSVDDRIDLILANHQGDDVRSRLEQSLEDEHSLRQYFPAADLRERLPVLTGLLSGDADSVALAELERARSILPAPWQTIGTVERLDMARATAARARALDSSLSQWLERAKNRFPERSAELIESASAVSDGLRSFAGRVEADVIPVLEESDAAWGSPVGRDRFVSLLRNRHMIYETPEELLEFGRFQLDSLRNEVRRVARRIDRRATPAEVWERLKQDHPSGAELPQFAYDEMQRALDLLLETGAVTVPENARTNVMLLTEGRTWETYPFGGYGGFELEGRDWVGSFMTSPPRAESDSATRETRLRGNNYYWARVVAVHEIYPGHHLQFVTARLKARPMRRAYYTTTLGEGWGLYSEQMMSRLGFFEDDGTEMAMLMMRIWRAARVIIDVSLHLEMMSFDDAVQFLVDNVDMDDANARAEVRRYMGNPTRPLSYLYGFTRIESLRRDYRAKMGADFSERTFHDTLLSYGPIPVPLIRAGMLGEELPEPAL